MALKLKKVIYSTFGLIISCLTLSVSAQSAATDEPRDEEIGAGGNIKLEKPNRTKLEEQFEWHAHLLWESRYITEGRDNLSGDGIYSLSTEFTYQNVSFVPWVANAIGTDLSEFNLNVIYAEKLADNLDIFVGYNHIRSRESGNRANDNEVSLDLAYFYKKQFQLMANVYYSLDAEGAFSEVTIKKGYRLDKNFLINISAIAGFNFGYVTDGHDGINHAQLRINLYYTIMKEMDVYAYTGYNLAINRDINRYAGDELLADLLWGGMGLSYRF